jgi:hypothetical protein
VFKEDTGKIAVDQIGFFKGCSAEHQGVFSDTDGDFVMYLEQLVVESDDFLEGPFHNGVAFGVGFEIASRNIEFDDKAGQHLDINVATLYVVLTAGVHIA